MGAHLALFTVSLLYGANYLIAKGVMPLYLEPRVFITMRICGALLLFMLPAIMLRQKVKTKHIGLLALCALFGVTLNQMFFFEGLSRTSAMNSSILMTLNPVMVMIMAAVFLKEPITGRKLAGIILGGIGAAGIITMSSLYSTGTSSMLGDTFVLINAFCYAVYLILVKPLMRIYHPFTVVAWVFGFGSLYVLPYAGNAIVHTEFRAIPSEIWLSISYVVVGTTFLAYLLNIFALRKVSPSVVSIYIYLQPLTALLFVLMLAGQEEERNSLTIYHALFALLIFTGVYLVSVRRKQKSS